MKTKKIKIQRTQVIVLTSTSLHWNVNSDCVRKKYKNDWNAEIQKLWVATKQVIFTLFQGGPREAYETLTEEEKEKVRSILE